MPTLTGRLVEVVAGGQYRVCAVAQWMEKKLSEIVHTYSWSSQVCRACQSIHEQDWEMKLRCAFHSAERDQ